MLKYCILQRQIHNLKLKGEIAQQAWKTSLQEKIRCVSEGRCQFKDSGSSTEAIYSSSDQERDEQSGIRSTFSSLSVSWGLICTRTDDSGETNSQLVFRFCWTVITTRSFEPHVLDWREHPQHEAWEASRTGIEELGAKLYCQLYTQRPLAADSCWVFTSSVCSSSTAP